MTTVPPETAGNPAFADCTPLPMRRHAVTYSPSEVAMGAIYGADMTGQVIGLCPCIADGYLPRLIAETGCGVCGRPIVADGGDYEWAHINYDLADNAPMPDHEPKGGKTSNGSWCERCGEVVALYELAPAGAAPRL